MRILLPACLFLCLTSIASALVCVRVYQKDGITPLEVADPSAPAECNEPHIPFIYRDIEVGTQLTIIVDSNMPERWDGGLFIDDPYRNYGVLHGRGYDPGTYDWKDSRYPEAGEHARVTEILDVNFSGFGFWGDSKAVSGDWFIVDYEAVAVGECTVGFYYIIGSDLVLWRELRFTHIPTRDFNRDGTVDSADFAYLLPYWGTANCATSDWCDGTDLNRDGTVDFDDIKLFVEHWLVETG